MFSPEFTRFLIKYQMDEFDTKKADKECIYFNKSGGELAEVKIVVK